MIRSLYALVFAIGCAASVGAETSSSSSKEIEHEHLFEYAAVYAVDADNTTLVAVAGAEEEAFAFMIVPAASADSAGLHEAEEDVEAAWENFASGAEESTLLASGDVAVPSTTAVYQVVLEDPLVAVRIVIAESGAYALFLEHGTDEIPVELISAAGEVLVPGAEEVGEEEDEDDEETSSATGKQWANALIASFAVSLCSLVGIVVVVNGRVAKNIDLSHACILASGALLATAILHIIPEAMEGLEEKYPDDLHALSLNAGIAILGGVSFGVFMHAALESGHSHSHGSSQHASNTCATTDGKTCDAPAAGVAVSGVEYSPASSSVPFALSAEAGLAPSNGNRKDTQIRQGGSSTSGISDDVTDTTNLHGLINTNRDRALLNLAGLQPVCWIVILGDLVHNFADGVTIGAAFLGCSSSVGWTVTAAAVLHEIPHELADFMALVNGGMSTKQAFAYNFLSALSAVLGVIIILALRVELTAAQVSFTLLVGAGSFIFIALSELVPGALEASASKSRSAVLMSQMKKMVSYILGALLIGLPLLFDRHCETGENGHDH